jgi:hypothetical protein
VNFKEGIFLDIIFLYVNRCAKGIWEKPEDEKGGRPLDRCK